MFLFNLISELLDQSASASKSFVTTLLAFPNEKSFDPAERLKPRQIAFVAPIAQSAAFPIHVFYVRSE